MSAVKKRVGNSVHRGYQPIAQPLDPGEDATSKKELFYSMRNWGPEDGLR